MPTLQLPACAELADGLESLDHSVLSRVFGIVDMAEHAETDEEGLVIVPPDQHGVRRPVPLARRFHQLIVATVVQSELRIWIPQ